MSSGLNSPLLPKRRLGANGPILSALGLGCMGMSDMYGTAATRNDTESIATIQAAVDGGVQLLNTGDFYGMGHNELLIGRALSGGRREHVAISVKFGVLRTPQGGMAGIDGRPASVKNFAAYSLRRLGVDVIDIYQPARVDPNVPIEDTVGAIAELIAEGKVRYLGASELNAEQLKRAHAVHPVAALEIEYSLATRFIEKEILPTARSLGIGVIAYGALSRGLLSGTLDQNLPPSDFRAHQPRFTGANFAKNMEKVQRLAAVASRLGATPSQVAIAWVMSRGDDIITLVGTTNRTRLGENLAAAGVQLSETVLAELDEVFGPDAMAGERYDSRGMQMVAR
jgi:aryl-alcohol dehydrogenase-like predicted oxidoreductase